MKILVIGSWKSGTSILYTSVLKSLTKHIGHFEPGPNHGALNSLEFHQNLTKNVNCVVKSLFWGNTDSHENLGELFSLYDKVVFIYRDPRDWIISTFFYSFYRNHPPEWKSGFDMAYNNTKQKERNPNAHPFHKLHSKCEVENISKIYNPLISLFKVFGGRNVYFLKYEDFVDKDIASLENYLGFTLNQNISVDSSIRRVERTKSYNNWKQWYNNDDVNHYKPVIEKYLMELGYSNDWELETPTELDSTYGSKYMYNLHNNKNI